jgi:hypothetical protein
MFEQAIMVYRNGGTSLNAVSRTYDSSKRRLDVVNMHVTEHIQAFRSSIDFPKEMEDELSKRQLLLEERFFGLT